MEALVGAAGIDSEAVARVVLDMWERLPRKGKPDVSNREWTVLASFVALHPALGSPVVLALATGTKCLPMQEVGAFRCVLGQRLNTHRSRRMWYALLHRVCIGLNCCAS
jgi:hypothetical protein